MQTDSFDAYKQMTCNSKASKEPFNQEYLESQLDNPWLYLVLLLGFAQKFFFWQMKHSFPVLIGFCVELQMC